MMPKKSKRVAARHAELSGRAKRIRPHGPAGIPSARPGAPAPGPRGDGWVSEGGSGAGVAQKTPRADSSTAGIAPVARARGRAVPAMPAETYFKPELRRIALAASVVLAILGVLVFVLR